ncbi:LysR family transcriptional regulator [Sphingomonas abietis]|uniref:LysR family transcriptional regulator n=1 Tax=Sphingomonas abietis TaxID=3012344 RepID=A0ABY7NSX9_9SPHN|nr:LysR family transcriptional regulator [Sphingomonas abietis]WBO24483.1 LysR family transcriptional regulator [Sphingomonas abietis]
MINRLRPGWIYGALLNEAIDHKNESTDDYIQTHGLGREHDNLRMILTNAQLRGRTVPPPFRRTGGLSTLMFSIHHLRYAIAAADHGSFQRAARALHIEESTLSRKIVRLEHAIGTNLFIRSRAGVVMTPAGKEFMPQARHLVCKTDRLIERMRSTALGRSGHLAFGYNGPISAGHLRATILAWRERNPEVELEGTEAERRHLHAALDAGALDLAILQGSVRYPGMCRASLWSERILAALPGSHPLADKEILQWSDLRDETFMLTASDPGPDICDMLIGRFARDGWRPDIKMRAISRESIMSVLGGGSAISVTYEGALGTRYPNVVLREVLGPHGVALVHYSAYWRADNDNPALRAFLGFMRRRNSLTFDMP